MVSFKKYIKKAVNEAAFIFLMNKKESRSKIEPLKYKELQIQSYFKTNNILTDGEKVTLFKLRVREVDVKCNYKNNYKDLKCTFCNSTEDESQYHLLQCENLIENCKNLADNINIEYEDIYENDLKQVLAAKLLHQVLEVRKKLIDQIQS